MANIVPRSFFDFSPFRMTSVFDDMDDFFTVPEITTANNFSISEDDKHFHVDAAMPGIKSDDIEVTLDKGILWIRGQAKEEAKKRKYYRKAQQTFSYRIAVPGDIDSNIEPQASFEDGMIRVTLTKSPQSQPKKLTIKLNGKKGIESKSK